MQKLSTQPYKGTRDFYPEDMRFRNFLFDKMRQACRLYGYEEYDGPMLESFDLYAAKSGEEIVNNELYSFEDRGGRKVVIRPEMTPTVARMVAARAQELPKPIRWFSIPNLWRYEAPQRGRLREHWQLNVDIFGVDSLDAEVEVIEIANKILGSYGATKDMYECRVNNRKLLDAALSKIGITNENEQKYRVCKAIDKKDKISQEDFEKMISDAGCDQGQLSQVNDFLRMNLEEIGAFVGEDEIGFRELQTFFELMQANGENNFVKFVPGLMRGFDYYTGLVFEFFDTNPENRRSLFGGGRYDDLVSIFNGQKIAAVGFGMGDVTTRDFLETHGLIPDMKSETDILVTIMDSASKSYSLDIAKKLRDKNMTVVTYVNDEKLDKQLKFANQKLIKYVVIAGQDEVEKKTLKIKNMVERTEEEVKLEDLKNYKF